LAFKEDFLRLPLVDIWIKNFTNSLKNKFPSLLMHRSSFTFIPTYDIDEAFAYRHKQWWRTIGGFAKDIAGGKWSTVGERFSVLSHKKKDPYDAFEWMDNLNRQFDLKPVYFFLVANKTAGYDKNIIPSKKQMKELILRHSNIYSIGIHPSWQSNDDEEKLKTEILKLGHISGKQIHSSRQHYIRFTLPKTYRQLLNAGISYDYSMGYGSINGFRASVATPFYWYDLEKEEQTSLMIYPFCFMEANSFYEQKFSPQQALEELKHYYNVVKSVDGTLITIWHNHFLGTAKMFKGWKEIYEQFFSLVKS
jgi:hypothetical protein